MNKTRYKANCLGEKARIGRERFPASTSVRRLSGRRCLAMAALLVVLLATTGCFESKVVTSKVTPSSASSKPGGMNGVFYALPRTVVKADVPVVRTTKQPGALSAFTPCLFPGEDYIMRKSNEFAVDSDKIRFDTLFIPDTEEIYMIKTRGGAFETRNLEMALTESGVLVKVSADVTNETIDIVTGTIKTGAGLIAKALPVFLSDTTGLSATQQQCRAVAVKGWVEELGLESQNIVTTDSNGNLVITEAGEAKLKDEKRIPEMLRDKGKFKKGHQLAIEINEQINGLLDRRANILRDQPSATPQVATVEAASVRLILDEIDKTVKELKEAYFFGTESKLTWNASFRLNPTLARRSIDLFTLSNEHGVCDIQVSQGVQLDPRFKIRKRCKDGAASCKPKEMEPVQCSGQKIRLEMALGEDGEGGPGGALFADRVRSAGLRQDGNRGFYYRIPGRAIAFIKQDQKEGPSLELGRAPLSIAQFGEVVSLPASTGGRRTKYSLELYEASGGLRNFSMGSSALIQQKNIDDLASAASTLIEAKGERKKAKAPADELQQLERQRKILEERKKIRDLEQQLSEEASEEEGATP